MFPFSLSEIAAVVGGAVHDTADARTLVVTGPVVYDSRRVEPGGMFVALPGASVGGHDFTAAAVAVGQDEVFML